MLMSSIVIFAVDVVVVVCCVVTVVIAIVTTENDHGMYVRSDNCLYGGGMCEAMSSQARTTTACMREAIISCTGTACAKRFHNCLHSFTFPRKIIILHTKTSKHRSSLKFTKVHE